MKEFIVTMLKFSLSVMLLPIVIASFIAFEAHLGTYPSSHGDFFRWGIFAFLITFLFLYQFWGVYEFGQQSMQSLLAFFSPADRVLARFIPFYLTIILLLFYITKTVLDVDKVNPYYMFFVGFAFAMHILLTAQDMKEQEQTAIKPTYFFWMSINFIIVLGFTILLFDLAFDKWSFPRYINEVKDTAESMYRLSFGRAFGI